MKKLVTPPNPTIPNHIIWSLLPEREEWEEMDVGTLLELEEGLDAVVQQLRLRREQPHGHHEMRAISPHACNSFLGLLQESGKSPAPGQAAFLLIQALVLIKPRHRVWRALMAKGMLEALRECLARWHEVTFEWDRCASVLEMLQEVIYANGSPAKTKIAELLARHLVVIIRGVAERVGEQDLQRMSDTTVRVLLLTIETLDMTIEDCPANVQRLGKDAERAKLVLLLFQLIHRPETTVSLQLMTLQLVFRITGGNMLAFRGKRWWMQRFQNAKGPCDEFLAADGDSIEAQFRKVVNLLNRGFEKRENYSLICRSMTLATEGDGDGDPTEAQRVWVDFAKTSLCCFFPAGFIHLPYESVSRVREKMRRNNAAALQTVLKLDIARDGGCEEALRLVFDLSEDSREIAMGRPSQAEMRQIVKSIESSASLSQESESPPVYRTCVAQLVLNHPRTGTVQRGYPVVQAKLHLNSGADTSAIASQTGEDDNSDCQPSLHPQCHQRHPTRDSSSAAGASEDEATSDYESGIDDGHTPANGPSQALRTGAAMPASVRLLRRTRPAPAAKKASALASDSEHSGTACSEGGSRLKRGMELRTPDPLPRACIQPQQKKSQYKSKGNNDNNKNRERASIEHDAVDKLNRSIWFIQAELENIRQLFLLK